MEINTLVEMAREIHRVSGINLGAASTREQRNVWWAFVVGCAHHGHRIWNPTPDPQWNLKRAAGRPQSDDVVVGHGRIAYDCITGAGSDGYRFDPTAIGVLPLDQEVYPPPIPDEGGIDPVPPALTPVQPYPDESAWWGAVYEPGVAACYREAGSTFPDSAAAFRWFSRCGYSIRDGMTKEAAMDKHIKELRAALGL